MRAWVYVLRLRSGGLYVGFTVNLEQRIRDHLSGHGCRTTHLDPPVSVAHTEGFPSVDSAKRREKQLKHWTRAKKEALIRGSIEELKQLSKKRLA